MDREIPVVEIKKDFIPNEHGLCESAETHWVIYLIQAIEQQQDLLVHSMKIGNGGFIKYLVKGENKRVTGFSFGAESLYVFESSDTDLQGMILVQESEDVFVGRKAISFEKALEINGYKDSSIASRWKDVISHYASKNNIKPEALDLDKLIVSALPWLTG